MLLRLPPLELREQDAPAVGIVGVGLILTYFPDPTPRPEPPASPVPAMAMSPFTTTARQHEVLEELPHEGPKTKSCQAWANPPIRHFRRESPPIRLPP